MILLCLRERRGEKRGKGGGRKKEVGGDVTLPRLRARVPRNALAGRRTCTTLQLRCVSTFSTIPFRPTIGSMVRVDIQIASVVASRAIHLAHRSPFACRDVKTRGSAPKSFRACGPKSDLRSDLRGGKKRETIVFRYIKRDIPSCVSIRPLAAKADLWTIFPATRRIRSVKARLYGTQDAKLRSQTQK